MRLEDTENTVLYFNRTNMFTVLQTQRDSADKAINGFNPDALLNTPTDDLVNQIVDTYKLDVPVLLRDQAHMEEPREVTLAKQDYGRTIHIFPLIDRRTSPAKARAAVMIEPVSADSLRKTGIFADEAGDFRRFRPQGRRRLETRANAQKAGIFGRFSRLLGRLAERGNGWLATQC
jgi:hypothetical protein